MRQSMNRKKIVWESLIDQWGKKIKGLVKRESGGWVKTWQRDKEWNKFVCRKKGSNITDREREKGSG